MTSTFSKDIYYRPSMFEKFFLGSSTIEHIFLVEQGQNISGLGRARSSIHGSIEHGRNIAKLTCRSSEFFDQHFSQVHQSLIYFFKSLMNFNLDLQKVLTVLNSKKIGCLGLLFEEFLRKDCKFSRTLGFKYQL